MSTNHIHTGGSHLIYSSTGGVTGDWYTLHSNIRNLSLACTLSGSSAIQGSLMIEASNDGTNALATYIESLDITSTFSAAVTYTDGVSIDSHWNYIRVSSPLTGGTTHTTGASWDVYASPHLVK